MDGPGAHGQPPFKRRFERRKWYGGQRYHLHRIRRSRSGADRMGMEVHAGACGKKNALKKVKTTTSRSYTLKKWNGKKLKKGKYYKFMVAALDKNNKVISGSKLIHAATKGGKAGNAKSVSTTSKANQKVKKLTLKVGKTFKLKAKAVAESKKQKISAHRSIQFESSNPGIAAVSKKGRIRAVSRGVCYVYAYAQNGRYSRVKVSVVAK